MNSKKPIFIFTIIAILFYNSCFGEKEKAWVERFAKGYGESICQVTALNKAGYGQDSDKMVLALSEKIENRIKFQATIDTGITYKEYGKKVLNNYISQNCKAETYIDGEDFIFLSTNI
ncbi:hypothetical protein [Leptospira ilyithenensis]|uniref:Uncharacterized protein n=1 Tax=Leptospira ilyithenensis TaxID=2484901 RepID=A0A4R9LS00_9LEPT|nr:hypothetical protein [Leptospira ilyithenensis]TGN10928.1 hypothetical protein EHS11_07025 [Leptospira ilyithenensis]